MPFIIYSDNRKKDSQKVEPSIDTIYQEKYNEMRRHRDHVLLSATWHSAILLALLSGLISINLTKNSWIFSNDFLKNYLSEIKILLATGIIWLCWSAINSIIYSQKQNEIIRYFTDDLEPTNQSLKIHKELEKNEYVKPSQLFIGNFIFLGIIILILIFSINL
jgi:hypothetical protein